MCRPAQAARSPCAAWTARDLVDHVVGMHEAGDVAQLWATATAIPAGTLAQLRTPGAFGPGIEVYGAEVAVAGDAPLHDRLLGFLGRDPAWRADGAVQGPAGNQLS